MKSDPLHERIRRTRRALRRRESLADRIALVRRMAAPFRKGRDGEETFSHSTRPNKSS